MDVGRRGGVDGGRSVEEEMKEAVSEIVLMEFLILPPLPLLPPLLLLPSLDVDKDRFRPLPKPPQLRLELVSTISPLLTPILQSLLHTPKKSVTTRSLRISFNKTGKESSSPPNSAATKPLSSRYRVSMVFWDGRKKVPFFVSVGK